MRSIYALVMSLYLANAVMAQGPPAVAISYEHRSLGTYSGIFNIRVETAKNNARTLEFIIRDNDGIAFYDVRKNNVAVHQHTYPAEEEPSSVHLALDVMPNDNVTLETADTNNAKTSGLVRILRKRGH